jgi:hypothetical protein
VTPGARAVLTVRGLNDTLPTAVVDNNGVTVLNRTATLFNSLGGRYEIPFLGDAYGPAAPFLLATRDTLQPKVTASLLARPVGSTGDTTPAVRALLPVSTRRLVPVKLPFTVIAPNGQPAAVAMYQRNLPGAADSTIANSVLFGNLGDTVRVSVPADVWVPGDQLYVIETQQRDSTVGTGTNATVVVKDTTINGIASRIPIQVNTRIRGLNLTLGCNSTTSPVTTPGRSTCNPISLTTRGSSGYLPYQNGWKIVADYPRAFDLFTDVRLTVSPQNVASRSLTKVESDRIRVVPNPYIVSSGFDDIDQNRNGTGRVLFTNVPETGTVRVYSVSGQFLQELKWTRADLVQTGTNTESGDLPFILRTREGLEMSSGLYLYVLTPGGANAGKVTRGKFVIIR